MPGWLIVVLALAALMLVVGTKVYRDYRRAQDVLYGPRR